MIRNAISLFPTLSDNDMNVVPLMMKSYVRDLTFDPTDDFVFTTSKLRRDLLESTKDKAYEKKFA